MKSLKKQRLLSSIIKNIVGICMVIIIVGPILITLFASFKTKSGMSNTNPLLLPPKAFFTFQNYIYVFKDDLLFLSFKNSMVIAIISIFFNIIVGSLTAFCLDRFKFPGRKIIFGLFYLGIMLPTTITEIARFGIITNLGLYNSIGAPIVIYVASDLVQLYIYLQFISKIPVSLDESAQLDGCSYMRLFWQIIFPLLAPASATVGIIKFVRIINDMYIPYLYMPKLRLRTLTTFLMTYSDVESGSWQLLSAAIILVMIPTILVYLFAENYIMTGLTAGAVKE
jgi:multiple sugar transport system permease protein